MALITTDNKYHKISGIKWTKNRLRIEITYYKSKSDRLKETGAHRDVIHLDSTECMSRADAYITLKGLARFAGAVDG